jgi:Zn-dependent protease with chaperone function
MIALTLVVAVLLLAGPVPYRLARSRTALRHPVAALLAWQAVGACTGLAAVGAALAIGTGDGMLGVAGLGAGALLAGYLLAVSAWVTVRTLARRRSHRDLLDLVAAPLPALPGGRLLVSGTPVAYCLPGRRPRVVLTSAVLACLEPAALSAVVAHERAHLNQRHHLVLLPFAAWHAALPFLPAARTARASVAFLVEALADDTARARVGAAALADALHTVALAQAPGELSTTDVPVRLARLAAR